MYKEAIKYGDAYMVVTYNPYTGAYTSKIVVEATTTCEDGYDECAPGSNIQ
jgi:hypothetical protein